MQEKLKYNICFAVSIGSLKAIAEECDGRQQGVCLRLAEQIDKQSYKLLKINKNDVDLLSKYIHSSARAIDRFADKNYHHVMLNLISFCMEAIKPILNENQFWNLRKLFDCFSGSDCYEDISFGEEVFDKLISEM